MPTSLYLTTHQPAKQARLIRSSICSISLALDIENGYQQTCMFLGEWGESVVLGWVVSIGGSLTFKVIFTPMDRLLDIYGFSSYFI